MPVVQLCAALFEAVTAVSFGPSPGSFVPPPVAVPPFAPVRTGGGGSRARLSAFLAVTARRRRLAGLVAALAVLGLLLSFLGSHAQAPERPPTAAGDSGQPSVDGARPPGAAADPDGTGRSGPPEAGSSAAAEGRRSTLPAVVSAPVRIADAEAVRLLRPGDRVDVLAAPPTTAVTSAAATGTGTAEGQEAVRARVVAHRARVSRIPGRDEHSGTASGHRQRGTAPGEAGQGPGRPGPASGERPDTAGDGGFPDDGHPASGTSEIRGRGALIVLSVPPTVAQDLAGAGAGSELAISVW